MSKPLIPLTIEAPGFLGLNSQNSGSVLPPGWATKLENFVFDNVGRLASRNGSQQINGTIVPGTTPTIRSSFEYIDSSGSKLNIFATDNKIFKEASGTMTDITGSAGTTIPISADNWQFANFNGWCVGHQVGHDPCILTTNGGTFIDSTGTQHNGTNVLSAYGRKWTTLDDTLYYSDLLIDNMTGGSSGNFNLSKFWPGGMDEPVALADFNGFLIVFGKDSMIIYENPDDPTVMTIVEGVDGVGCIARDSVQVVGKEILFLSNSGLRTLGRTIQEKSVPLGDVSKNVRDELLKNVGAETLTEITSVYNSKDGFYMLSLPTTGTSYIFDLKFPNEDGTLKVARFDFAPTALSYSEGLIMWMAVTSGFLSKYTGFKDDVVAAGTGGNAYLADWEGVWNDFGQGAAPLIKILKKVTILAAGTPGGAVNFKWAVDYADTFTKRTLTFNQTNPATWGVSLYNTAGDTYASIGGFEKVKSSIARNGQVIKIGASVTINGSSFALQRVDLLSKTGKIGI